MSAAAQLVLVWIIQIFVYEIGWLEAMVWVWDNEGIFLWFQINLQGPLIMRVSYNDYKLYLSILDSVSKQLNKAIKSEASSKVTDEIPDHDFDG